MYSGTSYQIIPNRLEVSILEGRAGGPALPLWRRRSDNQLFVAGQAGVQFSIRVRNLAGEPLLVVPSIDHRAVLEDKPASPDGVGFILGSHSEYTFDGWRKSDDATLPIIFTAPDDSVAGQAVAREQRQAVTGVIGLAVFRRRQPLRAFSDYDYGSSLEGGYARGYSGQVSAGRGIAAGPLTRGGMVTNSTAGAERFDADMGAGVGSVEQSSRVGRAGFDRLSGSMQVAKILYASAESLSRQGILVPAEPEAFPGKEEFTSYRSV